MAILWEKMDNEARLMAILWEKSLRKRLPEGHSLGETLEKEAQ